MLSQCPRITCVVCTRNRWKFLCAAVKSLLAQETEAGLLEILVVDNGSTDGTRSLVESEFGGDPRLRVTTESVPGLSRARNVGWREARGEFVAYLDDDAVASPGWARSLSAAFDDVTPRPGCIGGPIELLWENGAPDWVPFDFYGMLGFWNHGGESRRLAVNEYVAGGNMAFPRVLLEQVGGFDVRLGRGPRNLMSNEELCLEQKLSGLGYSRYYVHSALVRHWAHSFRLRPGWFLSRMYWQGVSEAAADLLLRPQSFGQRCKRVCRNIGDESLGLRRLVGLALSFRSRKRVCQNGQVMRMIGVVAGYLMWRH